RTEKSDRSVARQTRKETRRELRAQRQTERRALARWGRRGRGREAEDVMYGITYEAPTTTTGSPDKDSTGGSSPCGAGLGRLEDGVDQVGAPLEQIQVTQWLPTEPPGLGCRYQEGLGCLLVDGLGVHPA